MKEVRKDTVKEKFIQAITKDPHLVALIMSIKTYGTRAITYGGNMIILYNNDKTGINAILDPAKPSIFIADQQREEKFNISINMAIKLTLETFGNPEFTEIPKFGTNLFPTPEELKNSPETP